MKKFREYADEQVLENYNDIRWNAVLNYSKLEGIEREIAVAIVSKNKKKIKNTMLLAMKKVFEKLENGLELESRTAGNGEYIDDIDDAIYDINKYISKFNF